MKFQLNQTLFLKMALHFNNSKQTEREKKFDKIKKTQSVKNKHSITLSCYGRMFANFNITWPLFIDDRPTNTEI